jgi:hypothetical protein
VEDVARGINDIRLALEALDNMQSAFEKNPESVTAMQMLTVTNRTLSIIAKQLLLFQMNTAQSQLFAQFESQRQPS